MMWKCAYRLCTGNADGPSFIRPLHHDQARRVRDALHAMQAVENDGIRYVVEIPPELPEAEWVTAYKPVSGGGPIRDS